MSDLAIKTEQIARTYKTKAAGKNKSDQPKLLTALSGVDLEVSRGELFGLLGPNGAGKTTLIKILTTLLAPTSGRAFVSGLDVVKDAIAVRHKINMVSGGETSGYGILTVRENLWMFSQFYGVPTKEANERIAKMLKIVALDHKANTRISGLSTGERQRMNFCRGFITDPEVIFLDEPTLGLDVTAARTVRDFTRGWLAEKPSRTVLLTTHYMAEADELCDRIAIIDHGKVLACDTPTNLKRMLQQQPIFRISAAGLTQSDLPRLQATRGVVVVTAETAEGASGLELNFILEDDRVLGALIPEISALGGSILSLRKEEPTLEDVFLKIVGRSLKGEPS